VWEKKLLFNQKTGVEMRGIHDSLGDIFQKFRGREVKEQSSGGNSIQKKKEIAWGVIMIVKERRKNQRGIGGTH